MNKEAFNKHKWLKRKIHSSSFTGNHIEQLEQVVYESEQMRKQLSETEEKLKRMATIVVERGVETIDCGQSPDINRCACGADDWHGEIKHNPDCIVLEAQNWLKDKE